MSSNWDKLNLLQALLCERIDDLLETLDVSLDKSYYNYVGPCPIHIGNNKGALNLYYGGEGHQGYWRCYSHKCHLIFKPTIIGFIRGMLSSKELGWREEKDKQVSFPHTINFICKFLGVNYDDLKPDIELGERNKFALQNKIMEAKLPNQENKYNRETIRNSLEIPAPYFLKRGFSPEILNKYDVGFCKKQNKVFANRCVVPIYDEDRKNIIGFTGRSIFDRCNKCNYWHEGCAQCPTGNFDLYCKWHNHDFKRELSLYNFWFAKKYIRELGKVIVVEGAGHIWRLEMAGFHNGVALLGSFMSDYQQICIEKSGAHDVIICTDPDEAGKICRENIIKKFHRNFNLFEVRDSVFQEKDLGEMEPLEIKNGLNNIVRI